MVQIDCLSRLFMFDEAQILMNDYEKSNPPYMPMYSEFGFSFNLLPHLVLLIIHFLFSILVAILSGLRNQRNSTLARQLYDRMKELFPNEKDALTSASILLSNIYTSLDDSEQAELIRINRIKSIGRKVKPGLAWTEPNGELVVNIF